MPQPVPLFYVFHGTDEFSISETLGDFKRRLGSPDMVDLNTNVLNGRSLSLAELRHTCDAVPFLASRRLVIVDGLLATFVPQDGRRLSKAQEDYLAALAEHLPRLPETTRLVFVEQKPLPAGHPILQLAQKEARGYARRFDPPDAKSLLRWIEKRARQHGGRIEPYAAHKLGEVVGGNLRLLDQEIVKLVTYADGERAITGEDVDAVVPYAQAAIIFDLVDALGQRNGRVAARTLHELLDAGSAPLYLLAMIARQFRLLIQVKELQGMGVNQQGIVKTLGLHPFPARKLQAQAIQFTTTQLETVLRWILDADVAIKSGQVEPEVALDLLVADLATSN